MQANSKKLDLGGLFKDILFDIAGGLCYAAALECFSSPNNIAPGGVGGLSILINYLTGIPISVLSLALNLPLLLLAFLFLGGRFTVKTLKSVLIFSATLGLASRFLPVYRGDAILAALYAGVLIGAGLAIVFMRGSTTGGTDIVARLVQQKLPHISVGKLLISCDALVLLTASLVYRNVESALYATITIFVTGRVVDSFLYGLDVGRVLMIISEKHEEIGGEILRVIGRGCTLLEGRGIYTSQKRPVLLCALRKQQFYELKTLVHRIDPSAFVVAMEANEIIGKGFKDPDQIALK